MRALRSFIAHNEGESRRFVRGDLIPEEWVESIGAQSLVDGPLPHLGNEEGTEVELTRFPSFRELKTVEDVLGWVGSADDFDERIARVEHALASELQGRNRVTLVDALRAFLAPIERD